MNTQSDSTQRDWTELVTSIHSSWWLMYKYSYWNCIFFNFAINLDIMLLQQFISAAASVLKKSLSCSVAITPWIVDVLNFINQFCTIYFPTIFFLFAELVWEMYITRFILAFTADMICMANFLLIKPLVIIIHPFISWVEMLTVILSISIKQGKVEKRVEIVLMWYSSIDQ